MFFVALLACCLGAWAWAGLLGLVAWSSRESRVEVRGGRKKLDNDDVMDVGTR